LIIESHDHAKVVIAQSALISNFVARLSERIAEASQNNRRNPQYPGIPQPFKRTHVFSFSSEQNFRAEMTGDSRRAPPHDPTFRTRSLSIHGKIVHADVHMRGQIRQIT
jgi:hypothetical protein